MCVNAEWHPLNVLGNRGNNFWCFVYFLLFVAHRFLVYWSYSPIFCPSRPYVLILWECINKRCFCSSSGGTLCYISAFILKFVGSYLGSRSSFGRQSGEVFDLFCHIGFSCSTVCISLLLVSENINYSCRICLLQF